MNLEEMKKQIESLVISKGFYNKPEDIPKKLLLHSLNLAKPVMLGKKDCLKRK